jgi:hypothetical protein
VVGIQLLIHLLELVQVDLVVVVVLALSLVVVLADIRAAVVTTQVQPQQLMLAAAVDHGLLQTPLRWQLATDSMKDLVHLVVKA